MPIADLSAPYAFPSLAAQRGQTPDALLVALVTGGVELLKRVESTTPAHAAAYDPAHDPLAPFIGAFDSADEDPGWIERHDLYFVLEMESLGSDMAI